MNREPKTTSARPSMIGWISLRVLGRVVFQVGVLHDDDVAGGMLEAGPQGGALALVCRLIDDARVVVASHGSSGASRVPSVEQSSTRMISLGIGTAWTRRRISRQPLHLVVNGDDDRELESGRERIDAELPARRLAEQPTRQRLSLARAEPIDLPGDIRLRCGLRVRQNRGRHARFLRETWVKSVRPTAIIDRMSAGVKGTLLSSH